MLLNDKRKRDFSRRKRIKFSGITADKLTGNSVVLAGGNVQGVPDRELKNPCF